MQALAELYLQAYAIVERHYRRRLTLPMVARAPRQLQRAYDEIGLTTFAAHLRAVRLRNAAELLAHQPLTVTDVARLVGYRQPSHFVKAFRRRFGMTPGAFRDAARRDAVLTEASVRSGLPPDGSHRTSAPAGGDDQRERSGRVRAPIGTLAAAMSNCAKQASDTYSNPNSVDAAWPDPDGRLRGADGVVVADGVPALAARADGLDDEDDAGAEPVVPPAASKPNSPLA